MVEINAVKEGAALFRDTAVAREVFWRVVEDSSASQTERAGAAIALRLELDAVERARLRATADACAAPRLRVALKLIASEADDATMAAALTPIEDIAPCAAVEVLGYRARASR